MGKWMLWTAMVLFLLFGTFTAALALETTPAGAPAPTENQIGNMVAAMVAANPQFADPNKVFPGDQLVVPLEDGDRTYVVTTKDLGPNCFWRVARRALTDPTVMAPVFPPVLPPVAELMGKTVAVAPVTTLPEVPPEFPVEESHGFVWWLFVLVLGIALFGILGVLGSYNRDRRRDVMRQPPVIDGGLPEDPAAAVAIIEQHYPTPVVAGGVRERNRKVERGTLVRNSGSRRVLILTNIAGGTSREGYVLPGMVAFRVTRESGTVIYFLRHCGNLMMEVAGGQFTLPDGWEFRVEGSHEIPAPAPVASGTVLPVSADLAAPAPAADAPAADAPIAPVSGKVEGPYFCTKCGRRGMEGELFCPGCGQNLNPGTEDNFHTEISMVPAQGGGFTLRMRIPRGTDSPTRIKMGEAEVFFPRKDTTKDV